MTILSFITIVVVSACYSFLCNSFFFYLDIFLCSSVFVWVCLLFVFIQMNHTNFIWIIFTCLFRLSSRYDIHPRRLYHIELFFHPIISFVASCFIASPPPPLSPFLSVLLSVIFVHFFCTQLISNQMNIDMENRNRNFFMAIFIFHFEIIHRKWTRVRLGFFVWCFCVFILSNA